MTLTTYILERSFTTPVENIWRCWTDPALVAQWYGPGVDTIIHELTPKKGGLWLTEMRMPQGSFFQKAEYIEAIPNSKLIWLHSNTDENWVISENPMMKDWPRFLHSSLTLTQNGAETNMKFEWTPHEASDEEIACFGSMVDRMGQGWEKGMNILAELIES